MRVELGRSIEAIAYHGWGFGADCWADWGARFAALASGEASLRCADRGYFGAPQSWEFDPVASSTPASYKILLTHSYGLHWCPVEQLAAADLLICLAGFGSFHPAEEPERRRSQRRVSRMIAKFATDPEAVLTEFWSNCEGDAGLSASPKPGFDRANWSLLDRDLRDLDRCQLDPQLSLPRRSIIIHGSADRIAPLSQGRALADRSPGSTWIEQDGSHCFPFTDPDRTWRAIEPILTQVLMPGCHGR
jgi:pimeloyl-[acyl-carrier protein] methyl ester esterase